MLKEFKQFLFRGNVIDLAVGVVIGAAFGAVVNALVSDFLTPLVAAIAKIPDFSGFSFTINGSKFMFGHLINAIVSFLIVAVAIFFFVIKPMNIFIKRSQNKSIKEVTTKKCPECLSEIPKEAKRCFQCGQVI